MASVYWAWTWPTGLRMAYKQQLCVEDAGQLAAYCVASQSNYALCFKCHEPFGNNTEPVTVWITAYFPHRERIDAYADFHAGCHEQVVPELMQGAQRMADRGSERGAPRPDLEADPWAALGLAPAS